MLKKIAAYISIIALAFAGLVAMSMPASADAPVHPATLDQMELHGDYSSFDSRTTRENKFYGSIAMPNFNKDQPFYDVMSSNDTVRVYVTPTDPSATVQIVGGTSGPVTAATSTDANFPYYNTALRGIVHLTEAINQIIHVNVTTADDSKTYDLSISYGRTPQPKVISNSLTSVSTAGGTQGVLYAKNFSPCSAVFFTYKYVDSNGDTQTEWDRVYTQYINTDANGVSKISLTNRELIQAKYRDASTVADLVITNGYTGVSDRSWGNATYNDSTDYYYLCDLYNHYDSTPYAETNVPASINFFNPTVSSTTLPATISQHTAFTVSGPGITAGNANDLGVYFLDETTGDQLWSSMALINNNKMLVTVDGDNGSHWLENQKLKMVVVQWGTCPYDESACAEDTVLYTKDVNFTPEMATQVALSPAKGPVAGGNKVTITGHGLVNPSKNEFNPECTWTDVPHGISQCPSKNQVAYITIGGNPVTDLHVTATDFFTSSDKIKWDGVAKATFIVPAGAAGKADITIDMGYGPVTLSQQYIYGAKPTVTSVTPATVATTGGSMITLVGTNFGLSGTPVVIIDGVKSPYVVRSSATKVTAMVPEHTGTGAVSLNILSSSGGGGLDTPATITYAAVSKNPTVTSISPATDGLSGGTSVTITGTGFDKTATGVMFGANPAKVTAATATSLTVDVPTGDAAAAVNVVVGTPTGLVTKTNAFTYVADAGVTSVTPTIIPSTTLTADAKVTITGVGFGTAGKITVGSLAAANYTATSNGTTISNIAIPTTAEGTVAISIVPTGKTKALTTSVKVTGPKITFVGPQNHSDDTSIYFGDANPWTGDGYGIPAAPANSAGEVITVLGSGFGNAGTLKIGTTTVTPTLYTDNLITFVAPSSFAAGDYDVQVLPAVGTLTATLANAVTIGKQLGTPVITKIEAPAVPNDSNGDPTGLNTFWPGNLSESDLYTITGVGFLGSDNGASTTIKLSYYDYNVGDNVTLELPAASAISDTQIQVHLPRTIPASDFNYGGTWTYMTINTNDTVISLDNAVAYMEYYVEPPQQNSNATQSPANGLCANATLASDGTSYTPASVTLTDTSAPYGSVKGAVTIGTYSVPAGKITWSSSSITVNFNGAAGMPTMWGVQPLVIRPNGAATDGSEDIVSSFNCQVNTSVTTKLDGGTAAITRAAGTAFVPTSILNNKIAGTTYTEPASGYEFQSSTAHGIQFGWAAGLPKGVGTYYVRAKMLTADYDRIKYNISSITEVPVTITGTDITLTPKLVAGGSSLVYKGQLGDGTNGTTTDIGYDASINPVDAITSVSYKYHNSACTDGDNWSTGLPKNVAGNVCTGTSTGTGSWTVKVYKYAMLHNGEDMTYKYNVTFAPFTLTISKKDVTLSTVKAEKIYDGTNSVTLKDITMTGAIPSENPLLDSTFATGAHFADATAGSNKVVTLGGDGSFKLAGIYANNYNITNPQMPVTGIIKKADAELKVIPAKTALVMGVTDSTALTFTNKDTVTHQDPISDAAINAPVWSNTTPAICTLASDNSTVTAVAGGDCVIRITQAASTNYNAGIAYHDPTSTTEELVIKVYASAKDISIVADDIKVAFGSQVDPSISPTGLLDGDSFDGVVFDYYSGTTLLTEAPTAIGTYRIVPRGGSVTSDTPLAYTSNTKYIPGKLVITPAPPVITAIDPAHGPEAGGNTVTITGTGLGAVTSISLGDTTIRKPLFTVNGDGTKITFVVPAGVGALDLVLNAGTAEADELYVYDSSGVPGGTGVVTEDLSLKLALKLAVGSKLSGQNVGIQGGGLQPNSTYTLVMHSNPVLLYTGTSDADGNFNESVKIPATACLAAGLHSLILTGITPAGEPTSDTAKFTLVDGCKVGATAVATADNEWTLSGFLFGYMSSKLTKGGKSSLKALKKLLKGAKHITITGYTQTNVKSTAEKAFNKKLAKARTLSVQRYLKSIGVKSKWTTIGAGAVNPVSIKYQAKNRRVVIKATY